MKEKLLSLNFLFFSKLNLKILKSPHKHWILSSKAKERKLSKETIFQLILCWTINIHQGPVLFEFLIKDISSNKKSPFSKSSTSNLSFLMPLSIPPDLSLEGVQLQKKSLLLSIFLKNLLEYDFLIVSYKPMKSAL